MAVGLSLGVPMLAAPPASAATFSNATPIVSPLPGPPPGCPSRCPSDRAAPFPSSIAVSGLSGTVTDVNVTLRGFTYEHNGPPDADIQLVAPGGKAVMLMSDACGNNDNAYPITSPITLSFDDQAGASLPADAACSGGTFRPLDDDDDGEFPFHEPDEFPGGPAAPGATLPLSTFNGISPNGAWSLYMVDDYPNDPNPSGRAGQIGGGWSIDISTSAAPAPTPAPAPPPAAAPPPPTAPPPPAPATVPPLETTVPAPPGPETTEPPTTIPGQPGDFKPLASDTEDDGGDIVPWVVGGFLAAGALGLVAMLRPGGWRFWRR